VLVRAGGAQRNAMQFLSDYLDNLERPVRVDYLSSYIPRKCGVATYTKNLTTAINLLNPQHMARIIAMEPEYEKLQYPHEVDWRVTKQDPDSYRAAAEWINQSDSQVLSVQHEFGLYGGDDSGHLLLELLREVKKPIVTTVHTLLSTPSPEHKQTFVEICARSHAVVVMLPNAQEAISHTYGLLPEKIVTIHHGVEDRARSQKLGKAALDLKGRRVLLMSGLIGPDKGIGAVIDALPALRAAVPEVLLVIVGQTHPEILATQGEVYRQSLMAQAEKLGCTDSIRFVNKYLPLDELLEYYEASDIFLTPHRNPQQVTSGTLAYAIGMGKACISTKYLYAQEVLSEGRGMLVDFDAPEQIAHAALSLLTNPELMQQTEVNAYAYGRRMSWPRVASRYLSLFRNIVQ
jgi:glycosyltransferase involved in cell wall biosynthesis